MEDLGTQGRLFTLPLPNTTGCKENDAEQSGTCKKDEPGEAPKIPQPAQFVFTLRYMGVTVTKRFTVPYSRLMEGEVAAISGAYVDLLREELASLEELR